MEGNYGLLAFGVIVVLIAPELIKFVQACVKADSEQ